MKSSTCPIEIHSLSLHQLVLYALVNVQVLQVKRKSDVVLHTKRSARILQSMLRIQSLHTQALSSLQENSSVVPLHCLITVTNTL